ncbi:MAG TPA: GntR family transcriptional regulator [Burkholderiaceae bacterium]|nr:GntR family transcriptional regulator [Burkholderiaceae bacterium]
MSSVTFSPLYRQIHDRLVQGLQAGEWKPGEAIPSETELAVRYGVSQGTVRKAIDALAAENLLVRRQGRGTFVASHQEPRAQFRFLRLRPDEGEPHQPASRFLDVRRLRAPLEIARALELRAGETVVLIRRVLEFDGEPTVLDEIWLPGAPFKGLTAERLNAYTGPLYALLEAEYGTRLVRASERVRAVSAGPEEAGVLAVEPGSPLLLVERISTSYGDRPVEVRRGWYVTRRHHYFNELN